MHDRHSSLRRTFLTVFVIVAVAVALAAGKAMPANQRPPAGAPLVPIAGGLFESSGVVAVPGTSGVLFVDDGRPKTVWWMDFDAAGVQRGPAVAVPLGADVIDDEDITTDGVSFYVLGSQSKPQGWNGAGIVKFSFDARRHVVTRVESIQGLRNLLLTQVPELAAAGPRRQSELNIEGLVWDPTGRRLLLGLRSPLAGPDAIVVPLRLKRLAGPFAADNLEVDPAGTIHLPLGGLGIRGLGYDWAAHRVLVIAGAPDYGPARDFRVLAWNGRTPAVLSEVTTFSKGMKAEGVTALMLGGRSRTLVVFDTSHYLFLP